MYCRKCGGELPVGTRHCIHCGALQENVYAGADEMRQNSFGRPASASPRSAADRKRAPLPPEPRTGSAHHASAPYRMPSSEPAIGGVQYQDYDHAPSSAETQDAFSFAPYSHIDYQSGRPRYTRGPSRRGNNVGIKVLIIAVSVIIVVAAVVLYFVLRPKDADETLPEYTGTDVPDVTGGDHLAYISEMMVALQDGNKEKAVDIFQEHIVGNEDLEQQAQGEYRNWLAKLKENFEKELVSYEEARSRLSAAEHLALDSAAFKTTRDYIESLQRARETMKAAASASNQGDFLSAMAGYREVINAGQFFEYEAAKGLENSIDMYRTQVVKAVDEQVKAGNLDQAQKLLQEGLSNLPEDKTLLETMSKLQKPQPSSTPAIEVEREAWKEAYIKQLKSDAGKITKVSEQFKGSAIGSGEKVVAIADICGDETPELIYVMFEDYTYKAIVWGYDNGLIPLLKGVEVGVFPASGCVGIAGLKDGQLLIMHEFLIESFGRYTQRFEYSKGKLKLAESLEHLEEYFDDDSEEITFYRNDEEVNADDYTARLDSLIADIKSPLIAFADYSDAQNKVFKNFVGKRAMTYKEAVAFLSK